MNIRNYGWDTAYADTFATFADQGLRPTRVINRNRDEYRLIGSDGEFSARLANKFSRSVRDESEMPVIGDWVAVRHEDGFYGSAIYAVLPRRTSFSRKVPGRRSVEQVLAANIDIVLIVSSLDSNFNLRRLERYLTVARGSQARPVIVLNKADLCVDSAELRKQAMAIEPGVAVICASAVSGQGFDELRSLMQNGQTLVFLGSSGVGKSTLINALFGDNLLKTGQISEHNGKGRHTTTNATLLRHQSGCLLLDTPGLRELQPWCDEDAVDETFADVRSLTRNCRFQDCRHQNEPGCAVREALANGLLSSERYTSYQKINKEVRSLNVRKMERKEHLARLQKHEKLRGLKDYDREST